jgi:Uma2 family endonuclease
MVRFMVIADRTFTVEEFEQFILLPQHGDTMFELIDGKVYPVVSNNRSSRIAMSLGIIVGGYIKANKLGYVTGADGGYVVAGEHLIPDMAFMSKARQPQPSREAYNPLAPDLAIEVLSPTDDDANVRLKLTSYLNAGTTVWIVDPDAETVEVYVPKQQPTKLSIKDTLYGSDVLPGFEIAVRDIFEE